jgi:hypothetical protein
MYKQRSLRDGSLRETALSAQEEPLLARSGPTVTAVLERAYSRYVGILSERTEALRKDRSSGRPLASVRVTCDIALYPRSWN